MPERLLLYHPVENKDREPRSNAAWIYPGQGTQAVGMGKRLYDLYSTAKTHYRFADRISMAAGGPPITDLSFNATQEDLDRTTNAQPAIFVHNFVCQQLLVQQRAEDFTTLPSFLAGHSLGEYNALVASGAITFKRGLELVIARGQIMAKACRENPGGMLAVRLGETDERLNELINLFNLDISTVNENRQVVVGGKDYEITKAIVWLTDRQVTNSLLKVEGAFHSGLMDPAVDEFSNILHETTIRKAKIPIIANTTALPISKPEEIRQELITQLTKTVRWKDTVLLMAKNGVTQTIEIGSDKGILSRLNNSINGKGIISNILLALGSGAVIWKPSLQTQ